MSRTKSKKLPTLTSAQTNHRTHGNAHRKQIKTKIKKSSPAPKGVVRRVRGRVDNVIGDADASLAVPDIGTTIPDGECGAMGKYAA